MCKLCDNPKLLRAIQSIAQDAFVLTNKVEAGLYCEAHPSEGGTVKVFLAVEVSEDNLEAFREGVEPFLVETSIHQEAGEGVGRPAQA